VRRQSRFAGSASYVLYGSISRLKGWIQRSL
jgi:hypothetical protein